MSDKIFIFDTTLRDGEQSPGASMNMQEKFRLAQQLVKLRVDVIEAGFPVASKGDFDCVKNIADNLVGVQVAGLARCNRQDIETAWEALKGGENPRIHTFLATSDIHMQHKLRMSRDQVLELAVESVKFAAGFTGNVEFSAEDASRSDLDFVCQVFTAVIEAGAKVLNFPDTTGYALPDEYGEQIRYLMAHIPNIHRAMLSVHCHNDLGLAVANSLAAIKAGARQVECTMNGLGERAGNTALEEVVMAVRTRAALMRVHTDVVTEQIYPTSRMVSTITGMPVQPNKAIVGANAFAHESGIHQDGMLKERSTYEIMNPKDIGLSKGNLVLGKHSGRHALKDRVETLGYTLSDDELGRVFERFKALADRKKEMFDEDLEAILMDEVLRISETYQLLSLGVMSGSRTLPTAAVQLLINGQAMEASAIGVGPIDACFRAIARLTETRSKLLYFAVSSITGGTDAQGEVMVRIEDHGKVVVGQGADPDIITAAAKAYLNGLNRLVYLKKEIAKPLEQEAS
ncbi:MAG: 2-isopropylmalate synthase [Deltaproteobacteria bacterium CG23_combo_of_CG06-09_8_20_14_all_60_8]|nr:MAG: 2-isopropylmalate synthase [Desulfobacterales bacterium CG2_30_60_27]PIP44614.1 MAG: 2-isopropylmalate synthase [Deltaproteobacteria bacterium CG23_combo_of_CG06-09_8_20_14_all_60_8]